MKLLLAMASLAAGLALAGSANAAVLYDVASWTGVTHTLPSFLGVTAIPGVPEPATWAMMILGLGFVGAAMRMERRKIAAAAAA